MAKKKKEIVWMRILGASTGATGFILLGVGGDFNQNIGLILIGIGAVLIAGSSNLK